MVEKTAIGTGQTKTFLGLTVSKKRHIRSGSGSRCRCFPAQWGTAVNRAN